MNAFRLAEERFFSTQIPLGLRAFLGLMAMLLLFSASIHGEYVKNERTGQSYSDLQTAINDAESGDTLKISGTFTGNFTINQSLNLHGKHHATLDGNQTGSVLTIIDTVTPGVVVTIDHITIKNGNAINGGGINNNAQLTLTDVKVIDNTATEFGGGIAIIYNSENTSLALSDTVVSGNAAGNVGGGIYTEAPLIIEHDSKIKGNTAINGAGIYLSGDFSLGTITDTRFERNTASDNGGGIYTSIGACTLTEVKFEYNTANNGGGIYNESNNLTVDDSKFTKNTAESNGGGFYNTDASILTLNDSHVERNEAGSHGGGLYNESGASADIAGCEIEHNDPEDIYDE